jgi:hypothetical protein
MPAFRQKGRTMAEIAEQPMYAGGPMTAADWTAQNPRLEPFQMGLEKDPATGAITKAKIGTPARDHWNDLEYFSPSGASGGGSEPLKYVALLTQSGANAPVATILENTLGGVPLWDYSEAGSWFGTLAGAFTASKSGVKGLVGNDVGQLFAASFDGTDTINLYGSYNGTPSNGLLNKTLIEIIVYP